MVEAIAAASVGAFGILPICFECVCWLGRETSWICGILSSYRNTSTGLLFVVESFKLYALFGIKVFY